jgi:glucosamine--fructose-6-phosphate aminotransferase (isomerizing)
MCGIFGYVGKRNNAAEIVLEGLKNLEYRGYDSWGVVVEGGEGLTVEKKVGKIGEAKVSLPSSNVGLGHTRWATHGGVSVENAHPHLDCTKTLAVVHNGIVENFSKLRKELKKHEFVSETDTEVIVHLVEDLIQTKTLSEALREAFRKIVGLNAVVSLKGNQLVVARNGSPLVLGLGEGEFFVSSDASAILPHTKEVVFLEDNQAAVLDAGGIKVLDLSSGQEIRLKAQKLDWKSEQANLGQYPHFMIKEIYEQPKVIENIVKTSEKQVEELADLIQRSYGTFLVGCGTAAHAALVGQYLFSRVARRHVNFNVGSEFGYLEHFLTPKSLVLALSQSGETIDIIDSIKNAQNKGARVASLTNVLGSTLYRMSDYKILLGAGPEKSVCATKSFTAKIALLFLLSFALGGRKREGKEVLEQTLKEVKRLLREENVKAVEKLADKIKDKEHLYIVGRGLSYPVSLEAALKVKEVSYIHAEGFAGGELKHGVIALIEKGTPCVVFAPRDETYGAIISGAMEMKARGGYIIGISFEDHEVFDNWLKVEDTGDGSAVTNSVVGQLLAYFLAVKRGCDPDKPRNLAKSVTVK